MIQRGYWYKTTLISILLVGASLALSAQSKLPKPAAPFSITISTDTPIVKVGDEMLIKVRLTNISDHNITITKAYFHGFDASYQYEVRDQSGHLAKHAQKETQDVAVVGHWLHRTLKPGDSMHSTTTVSSEYDVSQPGEYQIQLSRPISGNADDGIVKSNTIFVKKGALSMRYMLFSLPSNSGTGHFIFSGTFQTLEP